MTQAEAARTFGAKPQPGELLERLRRLRGLLPADFKSDRIEANERDADAGGPA